MKHGDREYHLSMFNPAGEFDGSKYSNLSNDVKGHDKNCSWEGYISVKACGCVSAEAALKAAKKKK